MKKLFLVIGPEASGTRFFTELFSQHSMIQGTPEASTHHDVFDDIWRELEKGKIKQARQFFGQYQHQNCWLTRRSMPHGPEVGKPAKFMKFANLKALYKFCQQENIELIVLITSRSPVAHLEAWTASRGSVEGSIVKARQQYEAAYLYLFEFLKQSKVTFFLLSLEALLLDGDAYVQSIFRLMGLPQQPIKLDLNTEVNRKRYSS